MRYVGSKHSEESFKLHSFIKNKVYVNQVKYLFVNKGKN